MHFDLTVATSMAGQQLKVEAGSEEQERKVEEFMKKKEQELQHSCQVDKKSEGSETRTNSAF